MRVSRIQVEQLETRLVPSVSPVDPPVQPPAAPAQAPPLDVQQAQWDSLKLALSQWSTSIDTAIAAPTNENVDAHNLAAQNFTMQMDAWLSEVAQIGGLGNYTNQPDPQVPTTARTPAEAVARTRVLLADAKDCAAQLNEIAATVDRRPSPIGQIINFVEFYEAGKALNARVKLITAELRDIRMKFNLNSSGPAPDPEHPVD